MRKWCEVVNFLAKIAIVVNFRAKFINFRLADKEKRAKRFEKFENFK